MHHISGPISGMASPYSRRLSIGSGSSRSFRVSSESAATGFELAPLGAFDAKAGVLPTKLQWCLTINDRTVETRTTLFNTGSARSAVLSTEGVLSTEAFAPLKNTIKVTPLSDSLSASLSFGGFTPPTLNGAFRSRRTRSHTTPHRHPSLTRSRRLSPFLASSRPWLLTHSRPRFSLPPAPSHTPLPISHRFLPLLAPSPSIPTNLHSHLRSGTSPLRALRGTSRTRPGIA